MSMLAVGDFARELDMIRSQIWLFTLVLVAGLVLLNLLSPILAPFLIGIVIAYMADPLADWLEAQGLGRTAAVAAIFGLLLLLLLLVLLILVPLFSQQIKTLLEFLPVVETWVNQVALPYLQASMNIDLKNLQIKTLAMQLGSEWSVAEGLITQLLNQLTRSGFSFIGAIGTTLLAAVVSFYLLRDFDLLVMRIRAILPRNIEPRVSAWAQESDQILGAFFRGQLLVMLALGLIYGMGLFVIDLNYALLIGMFAGLASVVPYMGFFYWLANCPAGGSVPVRSSLSYLAGIGGIRHWPVA